MSAFDSAFERTVGIEGAYVDDPLDPGGETNWGVTWPSLREAIGEGVLPAGSTIKDLSREDAKAIYRALFWVRGAMDQFDPAVSFQAFDAAVHHGIGNSVRMIQRVAGVVDDGRLGPVSIVAVSKMRLPTFLMLFAAERLDFMTKTKVWEHDGRGFARRIVADLRYAARDELAEAKC